jgi:hypothetical protein
LPLETIAPNPFGQIAIFILIPLNMPRPKMAGAVSLPLLAILEQPHNLCCHFFAVAAGIFPGPTKFCQHGSNVVVIHQSASFFLRRGHFSIPSLAGSLLVMVE